MEHVKIDRIDEGYRLDPTPYLDWLARRGDQLPQGAAAFVRDPGHYAFGDRCLHALRMDSAGIEFSDGGTDARLVFRAPGAEGEPRLIIRYAAVSSFFTALDSGVAAGARSGDLGAVLLDEARPVEGDCEHEIRCTSGRILVACRDLDAEWVQ